jgi:hypothetical protein
MDKEINIAVDAAKVNPKESGRHTDTKRRTRPS